MLVTRCYQTVLWLMLLTIMTWSSFGNVDGKYVEGELNTRESWAFLARFCFLSEYGEFEYLIEFEEDQGFPNLLLYYDTDDQWPAVYKTDKTCYEKESVLHVEQNQIINLTTKNARFREFAGCGYKEYHWPLVTSSTPSPKYTISVPTPTRRPKTTTTTKKVEEIAVTQFDTSATEATSTYTQNESNNLTEVFENQFAYEDIYKTTILKDEEFSELTTEPLTSRSDVRLQEETTVTTITTTTTTKEVPIRKKRAVANNNVSPKPKMNRIIICQNARRFQSSRERWWFVAISNCNGSKGINIKYRILMTNGPPGDFWHEHFSADQFYILPVLMTFSVTYSLLLLAIIVCTIELKSRQLLHTTYKLFVFSAVIQFFGIVVDCAAYLKFAANGVGTSTAKTFGSILMGCSETCFLLLLLLLAKGYTITRGRLPISASVKLTIFMCLYSITYICIFIYEAKVFDPGEVLYLYESPAGYGLIVLRVTAWVMFIYSTIFTLKHYPEKSNFYYPFNIFGTMWFIAGPAFILSANTYIDKWVRESVVVAVLMFITFGGHLMFLLLTLPSLANKNFPYHVRTTQIGIMEVAGSVGNNTIEHFSHHVYEPNSNEQSQTVIIPLTRRTEEIFGTLYTRQLQTNLASAPRRPSNENGIQGDVDGLAMQNVLSWSLAKNYATLDIPRLERLEGSPISKLGDDSSERSPKSGSMMSGIDENTNRQLDNLQSTYEYTKEVPVELFTVSKMVITKNGENL